MEETTYSAKESLHITIFYLLFDRIMEGTFYTSNLTDVLKNPFKRIKGVCYITVILVWFLNASFMSISISVLFVIKMCVCQQGNKYALVCGVYRSNNKVEDLFGAIVDH